MSNHYRYSYSGADARVYIYIPGYEQFMQPLESVHTISLSIHEAKGDARALGHRGVKGFARGIRTVAGSLIMTVVEDHPLRVIMNQVGAVYNTMQLVTGRSYNKWPGWSVDRDTNGTGTYLERENSNNRFASTLPPFNILIQYVSEGGNFNRTNRANSLERAGDPAFGYVGEEIINYVPEDYGYDLSGATLLIEGIELIDEGLVTSVADIVTEMSFSFKATDAKPIHSVKGVLEDRARYNAAQAQQAKLAKKLYRRADRLTDRADRRGNSVDDLLDLVPEYNALNEGLGVDRTSYEWWQLFMEEDF